jgi:hypothetical protein
VGPVRSYAASHSVGLVTLLDVLDAGRRKGRRRKRTSESSLRCVIGRSCARRWMLTKGILRMVGKKTNMRGGYCRNLCVLNVRNILAISELPFHNTVSFPQPCKPFCWVRTSWGIQIKGAKVCITAACSFCTECIWNVRAVGIGVAVSHRTKSYPPAGTNILATLLT